MTSDRQIAANRRNSQRSTGPRTAAGKARIRRNALRDGLAATILKVPTISAEVERLATVICGKVADPAKREQALSIAESVVMLTRVRVARLDLIERMSAEGAAGSKSKSSQRENPNHSYLTPLLRLGRYERGALLRRTQIARAIFSGNST
jgi:hypothetical protein